MIEGFDRHYRVFRATSASAKDRFEIAEWPELQQAVRERIRFYDERVRECVERLETELDAGSLDDATWRQREAALHRPPRRPQAAGAGRDVLQLGRDPGAAADVRPQRLRVRAGRDLDRVHRVRPADLPELLPRRGGPAGGARSRSSPTSAGAGRSPISSATSTSSCRRCSSTSTASCRRPSPTTSCRCSAPPSTATRPPT